LSATRSGGIGTAAKRDTEEEQPVPRAAKR
jgi:hypothetical protein